MTFATATVIERHLGWRNSVLAYAIASYVAMSRMHDNRHYLSDVVFGAAVGTIAGRTVVHHAADYWAFTPVAVPGGGVRADGVEDALESVANKTGRRLFARPVRPTACSSRTSSISGIASSTASTSSRLNERPVFFIGIGPRGLSSPFFLPFALPPRCGLASGPKLRLRAAAPPGATAAAESNGAAGRRSRPGRGANPPPAGLGPDE